MNARPLRQDGRVISVVKKTGRTLVHDRRRAPVLEQLARGAIQALFRSAPANDQAAISRALVQEAIRWDASLRGAHEASSWASAQARRIDPLDSPSAALAAADAAFLPMGGE